jgi:alkyl hydroperoxide reductase subunit AhpC
MSSGKGLVYKIRSADKLYKVETSRNTAKWTLIQFPGKEYSWVATTELVDGGGYKEKKPEPDDVNAGFI